MKKITTPDKNTGDDRTAAEDNHVKEVVNHNAEELASNSEAIGFKITAAPGPTLTISKIMPVTTSELAAIAVKDPNIFYFEFED